MNPKKFDLDFDLEEENDTPVEETDDEDLDEGDESDEGSEEEDDLEGEEEADGEGSDEGSEDEDAEEDDEEQGVLETRGSKRIRTLSTRAKEKEAEARKLAQEKSDLQKQLDEIKRQGAFNQTQQQVQAYLATLPEEQRVVEQARIAADQQRYQLQLLEFQLKDTNDKTTFSAKYSGTKFGRFAEQVEAELSKFQSEQKSWAPREEVLKWILGKMVLESGLKSVKTKQAKSSMKKNKVRPSSSRSDVTDNRGRSNPERDRMKRLSGASF